MPTNSVSLYTYIYRKYVAGSNQPNKPITPLVLFLWLYSIILRHFYNDARRDFIWTSGSIRWFFFLKMLAYRWRRIIQMKMDRKKSIEHLDKRTHKQCKRAAVRGGYVA